MTRQNFIEKLNQSSKWEQKNTKIFTYNQEGAIIDVCDFPKDAKWYCSSNGVADDMIIELYSDEICIRLELCAITLRREYSLHSLYWQSTWNVIESEDGTLQIEL